MVMDSLNTAARYHDALWNAWQEMVPDAPHAVSRKAFDALMQRYAEPQRAYHTQTHLQELLKHYHRHADSIADKPAYLAILFYHDAIYTVAPGRAGGLNEQESAELALAELPALGFSATVAQRVAGVIADTYKHVAPAGDADAALFMDTDMAILAAPWEEYRIYAENIRREYAPLVSEKAYVQGRISFLTHTLDAGRPIFATPYYQPLQAQAEANMRAERDYLRASIAAAPEADI